MTSAADADQAIHRGASASARLYNIPSLDLLDLHDAAAWQPSTRRWIAPCPNYSSILATSVPTRLERLGSLLGRSGRDGMVSESVMPTPR